jgi:polyisoprenoid-binding protein YceI
MYNDLKGYIMNKIIFSLLTFSALSYAGGCVLTQSDNIKVTWKAYKTLAKLGVAGEFTAVNYTPHKKEGKNFKELLVGSTVSIDISKIDTKNEGRDKTLVESFFSKLSGKSIEGEIVSIKANKREKGKPYTGTLDLNISMNETSLLIPMNYIYEKENFKAEGIIDLFDFKAESALSSINKSCYELHKGKTWNDVSISFQTTIKATLCDAKLDHNKSK